MDSIKKLFKIFKISENHLKIFIELKTDPHILLNSKKPHLRCTVYIRVISVPKIWDYKYPYLKCFFFRFLLIYSEIIPEITKIQGDCDC